jgi:anti-sigma B factor antagonist
MKIQTQKYNDITVIELQGGLDADSVDLVKHTLSSVVSGKLEGSTQEQGSVVSFQSGIVFDMSNVGFIDSLGLEFLLWARDHCNENNCQLRLSGLNEHCAKILEITRLENEFTCYGELAEAVKSVV